MSVQQDAAVDAVTSDYHGIQNFYAHQMQLLDDGLVDEWAGTFTEDGTFAANAHPAPFVGRSVIAEGARKSHRSLVEQGIRRRHWLGMLAVRPGQDGDEVVARTYAQILETPVGGQTRVLMSTTCEDVLVRAGGSWLVRTRHVSRDDLA